MYFWRVLTSLFMWQTLIGISFASSANNVTDVDRIDHYKTYQCDDAKMENVLKAEVPAENYVTAKTFMACVKSCSNARNDSDGTKNYYNNNHCSYAVYFNSTQLCKLVSPSVTNFTDYRSYDEATTQNRPCRVAQRYKNTNNNNNNSNNSDDTMMMMSPLCQHNGQPLKYTCVCPVAYVGRYCQIASEDYCYMSDTQIVQSYDHSSLSDEKLPVRAVIDQELILSVNSMEQKYMTAGHFFLAQNFLDFVNNPGGGMANFGTSVFTTPFQWSFVLHDLDTRRTELAKVTMEGLSSSTFSTTINNSVTLYMPMYYDYDALIYDQTYGNGSISDVIDDLLAGHRKLERELSRVEFNADALYVLYENTVSKMALTEKMNGPQYIYWEKPLQFHTFKGVLGSNSTDVTAYPVLSTASPPITFPASDFSPNWEIDRCWTKVNQVLDYSEFTSVLREYAERGFDFRILVDKKLSSDVVEIQATGSDVAVQLPWSLTENEGIAKGSVISRSRTFVDCEREFQGGAVHAFNIESKDSEIEWFVSTRSWGLVYSVNKTGSVVQGDEGALIHYAKHLVRSIRVCVHYSTDLTGGYFSCHGNAAMKVSSDGHLLFQTPASFGMEFNDGQQAGDEPDEAGEFKGIRDMDCRQYVKIISSVGWIDEATMIMQSTKNDVHNVDFDRIDWFAEL